jgi:uncharacterized membrane protein
MKRITAAMALASLGLGCTSYDPDLPALRAFGNEPFWSVTIPAGDSIVYSRLGAAEISFPLEVPRETDSVRVYGPLKDPTGQHEIEVRVSTEDCQDTMADIVHPMRARVVIDGEELFGCARWLDVEAPREGP